MGTLDVLRISGELDLAGESRLDLILRDVRAREVHLDISGLRFIDARGFSLLHEAKARLTQTGHTVTVCGVSDSEPWVQRVLVLISSMTASVDSSLMPRACASHPCPDYTEYSPL
jgi:anti-anti-sigma factor